MKPALLDPEAPTASLTLEGRCKVLGLPTWRLTGDSIVAEPAGWGPIEQWLRAGLMGRWLGDAVSEWTANTRVRHLELFPGA